MKRLKDMFPSEEVLKAVRKKLADVPGSYLLPEDASLVDKAKYEVCKQFVVILRKRSLSRRELAKLIDVPETRMSEIVRYHIHKFTLDKLLSYLEKMKPDVKFNIS